MNRIFSFLLIAVLTVVTGRAEESEPESDSLQVIVRFLPKNRVIRNLHVPRFDEEGNQVAFMTATELTRIDDENFSMLNLVIHLLGDSEDDKTVIETASANYNIRQNILSSEVRTTIVKENALEAEGEGMVFDTERQVAILLGYNTTKVQLSGTNLFSDNSKDSSENSDSLKPSTTKETR